MYFNVILHSFSLRQKREQLCPALCRQLGFANGDAVPTGTFSDANNTVPLLEDVDCEGYGASHWNALLVNPLLHTPLSAPLLWGLRVVRHLYNLHVFARCLTWQPALITRNPHVHF